MAPPGYKEQKIKSSLTHDAQLVKMARHIARLERRAKELRYQSAELNGGAVWWVVARLDTADAIDLPTWKRGKKEGE